MLTFENGKQISPCIASKVRFALGLKMTEPQNDKTCSSEYWLKVVQRIGELNNLNSESIDKAKGMYKTLIR